MTDNDIENIIQSVVDTVVAQKKGLELNLAPDTTSRQIPLNQRDDVKHVALGSDHHGLEAKRVIKVYLERLGYTVADVGTHSGEPVDYPDVAVAVAKKVASGECERGIMVDKDGLGSSIACNKVKGIRAALCYDVRTAINSREHVNANVMTLGGPFHNGAELCEMAKLWLETRFSSAKNWSATNKMMALERS